MKNLTDFRKTVETDVDLRLLSMQCIWAGLSANVRRIGFLAHLLANSVVF